VKPPDLILKFDLIKKQKKYVSPVTFLGIDTPEPDHMARFLVVGSNCDDLPGDEFR
jgi:hypothetical protein